MGIESTDIAVGVVGGVGTLGLSQLFSEGVASAYQPLMDFIQRIGENNSCEIKFSFVGAVGEVALKNLPVLAGEAYKVIQVSQSIGISTGFWVTAVESSLNFYRGWLGKGERPFAVDIVEGGLRGSAIGLTIGMLSRNSESRGVQFATGAGVGFVIGMMSAFVGSIAGAITHGLVHKQLKEDVWV